MAAVLHGLGAQPQGSLLKMQEMQSEDAGDAVRLQSAADVGWDQAEVEAQLELLCVGR